MKKTTLQKIEALQAKINPLQEEIYKLNEEVNKVRLPYIQKMLGWCLKSTYGNESYGKILDLVESKEGWRYFIIETLDINKEGRPQISLTTESPYLNKEWWEAVVPIHGWEKTTENEYQLFKAKVMNELSTQKQIRKFTKTN